MRLFFTGLSVLLFLAIANADVFGEDNRGEVSSLVGPLRTSSQSVATMILSEGLVRDPATGRYRIKDPGTDFLCPGQRFSGQPASPDIQCGGTLIAPDLVITAAHCLQEERYGVCGTAHSFIFDYTENKTEFSEDDIYHCSDLAAPVLIGNGLDVALIRLDRPVKGRRPVAFSEAALSPEQNVTLVGPAKGLPLKASPGKIRYLDSNPAARSGIGTDMDCSGKNSGSPVFNDQGQAIGVFIASGPPQSRTPSRPQNERISKAPKASKANACYEWKHHRDGASRSEYAPDPNQPATYGNMGVLARGCVFIPYPYFIEEYRSVITRPGPRRPTPTGNSTRGVY